MIAKSINLIPEAPIAAMVDLAAHAEDLGFDRCWVYDEGLATRDLYVTLSAIATATSRMQLGPGITNPYTRHPAQTAAAIASIDELSGGRGFLGIGAGGSLTLDPLGIKQQRP
ncbi:MAG: LLM class flavin-dependent oxidoreductase, partial [Actinobacteria bacterium]|nr:LLM class flavin-dependent oxidoreductase [Actinomycetota bacterium]